LNSIITQSKYIVSEARRISSWPRYVRKVAKVVRFNAA